MMKYKANLLIPPSTTPEKIGVLREHAFSCIDFIDYKNFVTQSSTEKAAGWAY